ncbi:hypothetical protein [Gandjariella thermophila]|uniref:hypothetical protein n=1 Tax=Gandjariella thermophila TaxID=1931992 RepID=UPI0010F8C3DA|nr:hypothetical protein [Gandjariella thermophila]
MTHAEEQPDMIEMPGECAAAAVRYLEDEGWPAVAHGWAVWTLAGRAVDALGVPLPLAERVRARLRAKCRPTPVICVPGQERWVFLTAPMDGVDHGVLTELAACGIDHAPPASRIELPPTRVPGGPLAWVEPPSGEPAPFIAVAGAILIVSIEAVGVRPGACAADRNVEDHGER